MLSVGPALRVIIHLNEDAGSQTDYLYKEVIRFLFASGISGAEVIRPSDGFGRHHRIHRRGGFDLEGKHLPIRVEFVEQKEKAESLFPRLLALVTDGMIEAHETQVLKVGKLPDESTSKDQTGE